MQHLKLEPESVLTFSPSSEQSACSRTLRLSNVHSSNVAFKIKTTAPKSYAVRPNAGLVQANQEQDIEITLQPGQWSYDKPSRDRFLVQHIAVADDVQHFGREAWGACKSEEFQEQRLSVSIDRQQPRQAGQADAPDGRGKDTLQERHRQLYLYATVLEKGKKSLEAQIQELRGNTKALDSPRVSVVTITFAVLLAILASFAVQFVQSE